MFTSTYRFQMERKNISLKEKLLEHYNNRDFKIQKSSASVYGIIFYWIMSSALLIEGVTILIPYHFKEEEKPSLFMLALFLALWLYIASIINWCFIHFCNQNYVTKETKEKYLDDCNSPPGWKTCVTCMIDVPPRSHHCSLCHHCIFKRDHHCFFTGSCIGYHNQCYFVMFCLYNVLALIYAGCMQILYLNQKYPTYSEAAIFYIPVIAIWQLYVNTATLTDVTVLLHLFLTIFCLCACCFFLIGQLFIIFRGQTSYEASKQIKVYKKDSIFLNIYITFGNPFNILRLILFIPLQLPEVNNIWKTENKIE